MKSLKILLILSLLIGFSQLISANPFWWRNKSEPLTDTIYSNTNATGYSLIFEAIAGKGHNNPSFAIWVEDVEGNFLHELFVTKSVATGIFRYGDTSSGKWEAGERRYRAALPYFFHKKSKDKSKPIIPDSDNPLPDAYTGATPKENFDLFTKTNSTKPKKFVILFEVNQTWDFNNYWHNAKFPDNKDYRSSAQPSIIYAVTVDMDNLMSEYHMNPIGHGHYAGEDGNLYTDLSGLTTALEIFERIIIRVKVEK